MGDSSPEVPDMSLAKEKTELPTEEEISTPLTASERYLRGVLSAVRGMADEGYVDVPLGEDEPALSDYDATSRQYTGAISPYEQ
jgi:hypothetical protein